MLQPIKINGKTYKIKPVSDLSTGEFLEMNDIEGMTSEKGLNIVKYISWQTGVKFNDAFFAVTSKAVETSLVRFPDIERTPTHNLAYIDYSKKIDTVGQRHQVEESNLKGFKLLVFTLAVAQAQTMNIDAVNNLFNTYLKKPAIEILPAGFFFFKTYRSGRNKGRTFSNWLPGLIRTLFFKKRQELSA